MITLPAAQIEAMVVDQLGLLVLADFREQGEWNENNCMNLAHQSYPASAVQAIAEAFGWLRARGLVAASPDQTSHGAIFVTRTGLRVLADGPQAFYASERLQGGVHRLIEREARPQFLLGAYQLGVFASMKSVEVRVRQLAELGDDAFGVALMNKAFGPNSPLTDPGLQPGEQDGIRSLFVGAYAVFRNSTGHRDVNFDDVARQPKWSRRRAF